MIYSVSVTDLLIFLYVLALLVAVSLAACYLSACRAMRVDRGTSLRIIEATL